MKPLRARFSAARALAAGVAACEAFHIHVAQLAKVEHVRARISADLHDGIGLRIVEWRVGHGINTGRNVLAGADYLYDAEAGRVGFRVLAA